MKVVFTSSRNRLGDGPDAPMAADPLRVRPKLTRRLAQRRQRRPRPRVLLPEVKPPVDEFGLQPKPVRRSVRWRHDSGSSIAAAAAGPEAASYRNHRKRSQTPHTSPPPATRQPHRGRRAFLVCVNRGQSMTSNPAPGGRRRNLEKENRCPGPSDKASRVHVTAKDQPRRGRNRRGRGQPLKPLRGLLGKLNRRAGIQVVSRNPVKTLSKSRYSAARTWLA